MRTRYAAELMDGQIGIPMSCVKHESNELLTAGEESNVACMSKTI